MTTHEKLKAEFPSIAITTEWEVEPYYTWDGNGSDPRDDLSSPHNVTVTASRIENGELIQRQAYLGGCYAQPGEFDPEIQEYFEDLAREAIRDLIGSTIKTLPAPFQDWKFDLSNGCLHHPCGCLTSWFFQDSSGQWVVQEWADWVEKASALIAAINSCNHHSGDYSTSWIRKDPPQEWVQGAEMLPEFAINTLKP